MTQGAQSLSCMTKQRAKEALRSLIMNAIHQLRAGNGGAYAIIERERLPGQKWIVREVFDRFFVTEDEHAFWRARYRALLQTGNRSAGQVLH